MKEKILFSLLLVASLISLKAYSDDDDDDWREEKERKSISTPVVINKNFRAECGSCHMAYPPGLLPSYSWEKMMNSLDKHFGEDASLDEKTRIEVTDYLVKNSSDRGSNRRGRKILESMQGQGALLRISETEYFKRKHRKIGENIYKRKAIGLKSNCLACHRGAEVGDFEEEQVRIPKENELPSKKK